MHVYLYLARAQVMNALEGKREHF